MPQYLKSEIYASQTIQAKACTSSAQLNSAQTKKIKAFQTA
ncbi:hypothetical protein NEIELOOT_00407 [Neisseria elongata subsp. glycolytica ATCC 29315]|uniref:Uncharacterized protein n=1 Tax=Neisseria elongata subsp. glycolytica ATCC 29315 TaxID=546263 RepID=D4DMY3_NEIEG|nr:hypothetical protein NEIELOOT_00407 [Neisseria elongata subsp. glycolytica ATCC 29315]